MSLYESPENKLPESQRRKLISSGNKVKNFLGISKPRTFFQKVRAKERKKLFRLIILVIIVASVFGFLAGSISGAYFYLQIKDGLAKLNIKLPSVIEKEIVSKEYLPQASQEEAVIKTVKEISPAVVSIIISKDLPIFEEYYYEPFKEFEEFFGPGPFEFEVPQYRQKGTEKKQIGGGTGFIISENGMILTNKHVVLEEDAEYTVFTNDGKKFPAKVLAKDPVQDLALLKIEQEKKINDEGEVLLETFPVVKLGDSDKLEMGQTVIAIGNALGEFRNTVSVGVISGLGRKITASDGSGFVEVIEDVIQTDAAINKGNSGGPLLNIRGEVVGINTAMALEAQSIGFAIPINKAKKDIEQIKTLGKIVYPFLGIRYVLINEKVKEENDLTVDYGALIISGEGEPAITPGSAAEKAGLKEGDIILEFNNEKITVENSLAKIIMKYNPGDEVVLKILREGQEKIIQATLDQRSE